MKYYNITSQGREATVVIYGYLEPFRFEDSDVTSYSIAQDIADLDVDVINVRINSCGGSVAEGWAIYNSLKDHPARIRTYADGFVASAAVFPFAAGDERIAQSVSAFFFHKALTSCYGNADDLRGAADAVEKLNTIGLQVFADLGIDPDKILKLQEDETWITPDQALELGIATEVAKRKVTTDDTAAQQILQMLTQPRQQLEQKESEDKNEKEKEEPRQEAPASETETPKLNHLQMFYVNLKKKGEL